MADNSDGNESEEEYEVERLLARRVHGGAVQYEVKWVGYDGTTWEPAEHINGTLVQDFDAAQERQTRAKGTEKEPKAKGAGATAADPRRSVRERKSRLLTIGGHQVLVENNYTMEEGIQTHSARLTAAPTKPKGKKSAFNLFSVDLKARRPQLFEGCAFAGQGAVCSREWAQLKRAEPDAVAHWQRLAKKDGERYSREMRAYDQAVDDFELRLEAEDAAAAEAQKQVAAVAAVARTQRKQPRHSGTSAAKKAAARVESPAETARRQSNARLSEQAGQCLDRSVHFFHEIKAQLHPFISPRSYERLAQLRKSTRAPRAAATTLTETPACITHGAMRDYQLEGLSWLVSMHDLGVNQLIGDEMGLGKTLQTISLLGYLSSERNITGPHLIIVPLSVMSSWCSEFRKWCPSLRVVKLHSSSSAERERLKNEVLKDVRTFDVIVTTFEMAKSMENHLKRYWWQYLIVDEAHVLKNENSEISIVVSKLHSVQTMLLTGTPLQNNMHELWALLHVLHPKLFDDSVPFDKCFDLTHHISDEAMLAKAHLMMQHLMIRRVKSQVEVTVPDKEEMKIYCPLTDMQKYWTRKLLTHQADLIMTADKNLDAHGKGKKDTWKKLNNLLMQLRKVCNHPYQLPGAELDFDGGTDEDIVEGSGKLAMLDRMLPALQRNGHRCVIFSQFTSMLDILEDYIIMRGYDYARLDGSTNRVQRTVDIAMFNAKGSSKFIFLLSTRAGGLGVNLQTADTAILYDSDWNPQVDLQAMARVHRIGQTKKVHVYRFMTRGTVEERIVERAEKKLFLDRMVNRDSDDATMKMSSLDTKEVLSMLKFGAHAALNTDGDSEITSEEIDSIIDRTQTMDQKQSKLLTKKTQKNAADFNADEPFRAIRQFDGELVKPKPQSFRDIAREWSENNPKRARKSRLVSVHGHAVLQENNYSMSEGGISVMATSQSHADSMATVKNNTRQIAGKDYDHDSECFNCQDGGSLFCCSMCPASYHAACCGSDPEASWNWKCPQHNCAECGRTASSAGGTLFRCIACPTAYCEDHIPATAEIVGRSLRWEALGCKHQSQACYITCGSACVEFAKEDAKRRGQDLRLGVGGVTGLRAATGTRKDEAPAATAGSQDSEKKTAAVVDSTHTRAAIQECDLELFTKVCVRIPRQCKFDSAALVSVATTDGQRHRVELPADAKPGTDFNRWIPKVYNERTLPTLSELELKNWLISAGKEVVPNSNVLAQAVDVVVAKALDEKRTQEQAQKVQPSADVAKEVPRVTRRSPRGQQKKYSENALRERALRADDGAAAESGVLVVEVEIDGKTVHRVAPPSAPEGWTVHWDEASKQWFFWHDETESSTWELPACASTKPSAPPGWTVHWSVRSQRWFFWNADEKISIWQMPVSTELQGQEEQAKRMQEEEMQEQAQVEEEEEKGKVEEEEEEEEEEKAEESKKSGTDASVKSYRHYRPDRSNASSDGAIGQTGTMLTKMCINDPECQAWRLKECGISLHIARRIVAARSARPFKSARDLRKRVQGLGAAKLMALQQGNVTIPGLPNLPKQLTPELHQGTLTAHKHAKDAAAAAEKEEHRQEETAATTTAGTGKVEMTVAEDVQLEQSYTQKHGRPIPEGISKRASTSDGDGPAHAQPVKHGGGGGGGGGQSRDAAPRAKKQKLQQAAVSTTAEVEEFVEVASKYATGWEGGIALLVQNAGPTKAPYFRPTVVVQALLDGRRHTVEKEGVSKAAEDWAESSAGSAEKRRKRSALPSKRTPAKEPESKRRKVQKPELRRAPPSVSLAKTAVSEADFVNGWRKGHLPAFGQCLLQKKDRVEVDFTNGIYIGTVLTTQLPTAGKKSGSFDAVFDADGETAVLTPGLNRYRLVSAPEATGTAARQGKSSTAAELAEQRRMSAAASPLECPSK